MNFNSHWNLAGKHARLSPSQYHWIRYTEEKLEQRLITWAAAQRGNELHALACDLIRLNQKLPKNSKTLNAYVNDCIGYRMTPELVLFATDYCFGTADAIGFSMKEALLRIFDLKTGESPASIDQLLVYAAIFCIEYGRDLGLTPFDLNYDLRIYQADEIQRFEVDPADIAHIIDQITTFSRIIDARKAEGLA